MPSVQLVVPRLLMAQKLKDKSTNDLDSNDSKTSILVLLSARAIGSLGFAVVRVLQCNHLLTRQLKSLFRAFSPFGLDGFYQHLSRRLHPLIFPKSRSQDLHINIIIGGRHPPRQGPLHLPLKYDGVLFLLISHLFLYPTLKRLSMTLRGACPSQRHHLARL